MQIYYIKLVVRLKPDQPNCLLDGAGVTLPTYVLYFLSKKHQTTWRLHAEGTFDDRKWSVK